MVTADDQSFEDMLADTVRECGNPVEVTSYTHQESAPAHLGFTARFADGAVYEVLIQRKC